MPSLRTSPSRREPQPHIPEPVLLPERAPRDGSPLLRAKPWLDLTQTVLAIVAFFAGYSWFLQQRSNKPNLKLEQTITQRAVAQDPAHILITLDVRATNIGKVKVELDGGSARLIQINPITAENGSAPSFPFMLKKITLEPGETDQALFTTLKVPISLHTLQVSTNYPVPGTKNYWTFVSAADLGSDEARKTVATSVTTSAQPATN